MNDMRFPSRTMKSSLPQRRPVKRGRAAFPPKATGHGMTRKFPASTTDLTPSLLERTEQSQRLAILALRLSIISLILSLSVLLWRLSALLT